MSRDSRYPTFNIQNNITEVVVIDTDSLSINHELFVNTPIPYIFYFKE